MTMNKAAAGVLCAALAALGLPALASSTRLDPGVVAGVYKFSFKNATVDGGPYRSEDILEIVRRSPSLAYFRFHMEFYNGHICAAEGIAEARGQSLVYDIHRDWEGKVCKLTLRVAPDKIVFSDPDGVCRMSFCGARGVLQGESFARPTRRPIRYMNRLLASRQFAAAVAEYGAAHPR